MACGEPRLKYPAAKKVDVVDDYFGVKVADPYRWLEDENSKDTKAWVAAENRLTFGFLHSSPAYEKIKKRLTELWNFPKYSAPRKVGDRYFFWKNDGLQNQSVLYMQKSLDSPPKVVLDPNQLSTDGTVSVSALALSRDGKLLAYGLSSSGSDWQEIKIQDVDSGKDYKEVLKWCKFSSIAWKHDGSGFFYNRFPAEGTVPKEDRNNYNRVYWHKPGTDQSADKLVYQDNANKELGFSPLVSEDGKYLLLEVWRGTDPNNRIYYRPVNSKRPFIKVLNKNDAAYSYLYNQGSKFYFKTDKDAPRGRIVLIDFKKPAQKFWKEIIPQQKEVLHYAKVVNGMLVVDYMKDAHDIIRIYTLDGKFVRELKLPTLGSVYSISGRPQDSEMFITFASFLFPPTIYRYDFTSGKMHTFRKPEINFDADRYVTKQVFYRSKDGTRVPMFITHRKDLKMDGNNPTLLYGYGGFDISLTPSFSVARLVWLENGGVYALANLRGGGEYGEEWHRAGMLDKKQNVFDDFIAAAEYLIKEKYTNPKRLAINGGSNGGLLVAACMVQRPDLFGAVLCQVPVIDMLRYHKFTVGRYWIPEYGNAEADSNQFKFLYAYSPLHNIKEGVEYPPTLVTTAESDNRVAPLHAMKFVATLQEKYKGRNPILIRVETKAGHGAGKPTSKRIAELADLYTFLFKVFGMD
ncbi:MAG TPA: S9 family peptidase [Caldithrix abyssi]|uniref:prolyl oligopeptidase n=1 Tax=Caldithrix abyssi TaxID=187145 RepID=A0A7V5UG06_CALAY|nr:S9 family peptidase [Caldithrix abyssi]